MINNCAEHDSPVVPVVGPHFPWWSPLSHHPIHPW